MRTRLITNGLDWHRLQRASESKVDVVHIELEDGIRLDSKVEAREMIVKALHELNWAGKLTMVRVNHYASGLFEDDIVEVSKGRPGAILLGKCRGVADVQYADRLLGWTERKLNIEQGSIRLAVDVETLDALLSLQDVVVASHRLMALTIGLSDLASEFGYRRTYRDQELETLYARSKVVMAAHSAGLIAFAPPSLFYRDLDQTYEYARWAYQQGFDAGTCVSPVQIDAVARAFSPSEDEISWARSVLDGEREALDRGAAAWPGRGLGDVKAESAIVMLDAPHAAHARRIIERARKAGLIRGDEG